MDYKRNGTTLELTVDHDEQMALKGDRFDCDFHGDDYMRDLFEDLMANSELEWIDPSETGDLTDAPMLGSRGENGEVVERWAFMNYQTTSLQWMLSETGKAVLVSE